MTAVSSLRAEGLHRQIVFFNNPRICATPTLHECRYNIPRCVGNQDGPHNPPSARLIAMSRHVERWRRQDRRLRVAGDRRVLERQHVRSMDLMHHDEMMRERP